MKNRIIICISLLGLLLCSNLIIPLDSAFASQEELNNKRMALYKKTEALTFVPWYYLAAIDQYERNIEPNKSDQLVSIQFDENEWYGALNITKNKEKEAIDFFEGIGKSGDEKTIADPTKADDILYTMANVLLEKGQTEDDFKIALWEYYKRDLTVKTIINTAHVFKKFQTTHLTERSFPVDLTHNYSYQNTWGDSRGFGGRRIHEGTDIFANYGVPVLSTTYGVVELKGWNLYGGWRIGIRDINNVYHYFAHLNGFEKDVKVGQIVKPGDVIGTVGATGYGPPGTSGKFPPHLHFGLYQDNGKNEWSFDPYPYLKRWEQMKN